MREFAGIFWNILVVHFQEYAGKFQKGVRAQGRERREGIGKSQEGIVNTNSGRGQDLIGDREFRWTINEVIPVISMDKSIVRHPFI